MKTMKRLFGIVLMLMVGMVTNAQVTTEPQEEATEQTPKVTVDIGQFKGGTITTKEPERVVTKNDKDEEVVTYEVTLTVTPDEGFYISKEDIVVVATYPLPQKKESETRADADEDVEQPVIGKTLVLEGDDPEDLTAERTYHFTLEDGLGAWVQEANFHPIASEGKIGDVAWKLSSSEAKSGDATLTLTLDGEGGAMLSDGSAPWIMRASEITNVVVSKGITELGAGLLSGCEKLISIEIQKNDGIVTLGKDAIPANKNLKVSVPGNLLNQYQITDGWKDLSFDNKNAIEMKGVKFVKDKNQYDVYAAETDQMVPYGLEAYELTGIQGNKILWTEVNTLSKGKPMLLYSKEITTDDDNKMFTAAAPVQSKTRADEGEKEEEPIIKCVLKVVPDNEETQKIKGLEVKLGQVYLLYNDVFYLSQAGIIPIGGIYLEITKDDENAPVNKTRSFLTLGGNDDEATAIKSLTPALSKGEGVWYSLDGRRLNGQPKAKGIYIFGGKKMVIR